MPWLRPLLPSEHAFVHMHFGAALAPVQARLRLHRRRLGWVDRAWSLNGGHIAMPHACFEDGDLQAPLRLASPAVAGLFAHELLHQWQRLHGQRVTRQSAWLQLQMALGRCNPYAYAPCDDATAMLARFLSAQVEQQAQMWQDHVQACVAGRPDPVFTHVAAHVRGELKDCFEPASAMERSSG